MKAHTFLRVSRKYILLGGFIHMKAAVFYGTKDVRIEDVKEPVVSAGKVKVAVAWTVFAVVICMRTIMDLELLTKNIRYQVEKFH